MAAVAARVRRCLWLLLLFLAGPDAAEPLHGGAAGGAGEESHAPLLGHLRSGGGAAGLDLGRLPRYELLEAFIGGGREFFSLWNFWTAADPSGGAVQYVGREEAFAKNLANASAERVYLGADMWTKTGRDEGRRSVRIQSKATYKEGLFVLALDHAPTGCGTWPAFWMYGEDETHTWPKWGEYDIFETVHGVNYVKTALHTTAGCEQSHVAPGLDLTGSWQETPRGEAADNCDVEARGQFNNQGCSQRGPRGSSGPAFNAQGGGTFAAEWDPRAQHIRTWFWRHGDEPEDLRRRRPEPDDWGLPYSYFGLDPDRCPARHFDNMRLVFDLTFCGDLGDASFAEHCESQVSQNLTCREYVSNYPENMKDAFWSIRALDVYQRAYPRPTPVTVLAKGPSDHPGDSLAPLARPHRTRPPGRHGGGFGLYTWVEVILLSVALTSVTTLVVILLCLRPKNADPRHVPYNCMERQLSGQDGRSLMISRNSEQFVPSWLDLTGLHAVSEAEREKRIVHL